MKFISRKTFVLLFAVFLFLNSGCNRSPKSGSSEADLSIADTVFKVTFIELGSVRCIPCQQMQTVIKSIEQKYGDEVKIVFHDVWTDAGAPFGKEFGITSIPTQVFLDQSGKEYFRHEGFFPEEELVKILNLKGVE